MENVLSWWLQSVEGDHIPQHRENAGVQHLKLQCGADSCATTGMSEAAKSAAGQLQAPTDLRIWWTVTRDLGAQVLYYFDVCVQLWHIFPFLEKKKSEHTQNSWTCCFMSQFLQPGATFCKELTCASCIRSLYKFGLVMCSHTFIMLPEYLSLTWHNLQTACSCQHLYCLVFGWLVDS